MCPDTLILGHFPGHLTSTQRCTIRAHYSVGAAWYSRLSVRAALSARDLTEVLASTRDPSYLTTAYWINPTIPSMFPSL
jgi:hypothetical protein